MFVWEPNGPSGGYPGRGDLRVRVGQFRDNKEAKCSVRMRRSTIDAWETQADALFGKQKAAWKAAEAVQNEKDHAEALSQAADESVARIMLALTENGHAAINKRNVEEKFKQRGDEDAVLEMYTHQFLLGASVHPPGTESETRTAKPPLGLKIGADGKICEVAPGGRACLASVQPGSVIRRIQSDRYIETTAELQECEASTNRHGVMGRSADRKDFCDTARYEAGVAK